MHGREPSGLADMQWATNEEPARTSTEVVRAGSAISLHGPQGYRPAGRPEMPGQAEGAQRCKSLTLPLKLAILILGPPEPIEKSTSLPGAYSLVRLASGPSSLTMSPLKVSR